MKKALVLLFVFICASVNAQRFVKEVSTISELQALNPGDVHKSVFVKGYSAPNDGGGGLFFLTNTVSGTNTGTRFSSVTNGYSWQREYDQANGFNVKWFGAKGDDSTDNYSAITNAIGVISGFGGGTLYIPQGTFRFSSGISVPQFVQIVGEGSRASKLKFTGTSGYAITGGDPTAGALIYGIKFADFGLNLTSTTASGIRLAGTSGAELDNIYMEGIPVNTSTGIYIDGGNAANIFTSIFNVTVNHFKFGLSSSSSGSSHVTSITSVGLNVLCDSVSGSIGINIAASGGSGNGDGCRFYSGNIEACDIGIKTDSSGTLFDGIRFEPGNTTDLYLDTTAEGNSVIGCFGMANVTKVATTLHNVFYGNHSASNNEIDDVFGKNLTIGGGLEIGARIGGNITLNELNGGNRYIIFKNNTTGSLALQAGIGSEGFGGAILLYGSSHATHPNDVVMGINGAGAKFRVNTGSFDSGTDALVVDRTTGNLNIAGAFTSTNGITGRSTLNISGLSSLDSLRITNAITGLSTLNISGISSFDSIRVTNGITGLSTLDLAGLGRFKGDPGIKIADNASQSLLIQGTNNNSTSSLTFRNGNGGSEHAWAIGGNASGSSGEFYIQDVGFGLAMVIAKNTLVMTNLSTVESTSSGTGGFVSLGGIGIAKNANIGGGLNVTVGITNAGPAIFNGDVTNNGKITITNSFRTTPVSPAQITANQNDYAIPTAPWIRLSSDASRNITGFVGKSDGHRVLVHNVGAQPIVFQNANVGSVATNRFTFSTGADITVSANGHISLIYDGTTQVWRDY